MERHEILAKMRSVLDDLPQLPTSVTEVLSLLDNPKASAEDITQAILPDPGLTTRILKVANSAYYGFSSTISSISRAVPLLGLETVKSLALSVGISDGLQKNSKSGLISKDGLWRHSLFVADASVELAKRLAVEAEYVFVLGFLHDMGKLILERSFPKAYEVCLDKAYNEGMDLSQVERRVIGYDHGEVGALLLARWKFPKVIINPVRYHHGEALPSGPDTVDIAMIRITNTLVNQVETQQDEILSGIITKDLKYLEIGKRDLKSLKKHIQDSQEKVETLLNSMI